MTDLTARQRTRKQAMRQDFEDHFYATWPNEIKRMSNQELINLNTDKLQDVGAAHPETLLCLKTWVLWEMAERGI